MSISIRCPACGVSLRVDDSLAGRRVRCSGCKQPFTAEVEPAEEEPVEEEVRRPAKRISLRRPAVDQPLIPKRRPRDDDDERPAPVPVWKREMMGAGVYLGCLGVFSLLSIGAVLIFMYFFQKQVTPLIAPAQVKSEIEIHLENLTGLDPNKRIDAARRLRGAEPNVPRRDEIARALAKCLGDANPESNKAASEALVVWATPETATDLAAALANPSPEIRKNCLQALEKIGASAEMSVQGKLESSDKNLRRELCALLGRIGTRSSLAALENLAAKDPDKGVQSTANSAARTIQKRSP